jgi:hypothetical protein
MMKVRTISGWLLVFAVVSRAAVAAEPDQVSGERRTADGAGEISRSAAESVGPAVDTSATGAESSSANVAQPSSPSAVRRPPLTETRSGSDRLELDTTVVTGNRELPKVLYIVPWKKADMGDLPGQPFNTLLDEVLTPVDRDVFRREVTYYGAVAERADATQSTSPARP